MVANISPEMRHVPLQADGLTEAYVYDWKLGIESLKRHVLYLLVQGCFAVLCKFSGYLVHFIPSFRLPLLRASEMAHERGSIDPVVNKTGKQGS